MDHTMIAGPVALLVAVRGMPQRAAAQRTAGGPARPTIVLDRVTVVDVEQGKLLADQRVVIAGTRIQAVGQRAAVRLPRGAQIVDARGKYLIPGLWDMHIHPGQFPEVFYPLLLANGVTGIRDAGSPVPLDTQQLWRREILAGTRVGPPRQMLSGKAIDDGNCPLPRQTQWPTTCVADTADARHLVDSLRAAGADMIKPHSLSPAVYFAVAAEARRLGVPFGGHVGAQAGDVTAEEAADSGARIVDHVRFKNPFHPYPVPFSQGLQKLTDQCLQPLSASVETCRKEMEYFRRHDTWASVDLVVYPGRYPGHQEFWAGGPLPVEWLRDSILTRARGDSVRARGDSAGTMRFMDQVRFPILAGTDMTDLIVLHLHQIPGFFLQAQMAAYVAAGLSPLNALRSATLNPAQALHVTDSLGTVAAGKLADLVLLDADPLADIANLTAIRAVMANGRYFDRTALDGLLADGRRAARVALEAIAKAEAEAKAKSP